MIDLAKLRNESLLRLYGISYDRVSYDRDKKSIMIVGHGANSMTMEEARAKLCAEVK